MKTATVIPLLALALFVVGCASRPTIETTAAVAFDKYPPADKINLNVGLVLTPTYRATRWEFHGGGMTVLFPIGDNLVTNSEYMASRLFASAQVLDAPVAPAGSSINAFLIPRVSAFEGSSGAFAWDKLVRTLIVEWTLKDSQGNVVWVDTVRGEATGRLGTAFSQIKNDERITGEAIDQLFLKSYQAISAAPQINRFAAGK